MVNALIQQSVNMQLKAHIHLSAIETFRLRRGMYNHRAAAWNWMRGPDVFTSFCETATPREILEILYVSHCLRDLAKDHIMHLEDFLVDKIRDGILQPKWMPDESEYLFFGLDGGSVLQKDWLANAPWLLSLQELSDMTLPVNLTDMEKFEVDWDSYVEPLHCDEALRSRIPLDYRFNEASFSGIDQPVQPKFRCDSRTQFEAEFRKLLDAIPLGYMIWDDNRLTKMQWLDHLPKTLNGPSSIINRQQDRLSVEHRVNPLLQSANAAISSDKANIHLLV